MIKKYFFYLALLFPWSVLLLVMPLTTYDMNGEQMKCLVKISAKKHEAVLPQNYSFLRSEKPEVVFGDTEQLIILKNKEEQPLPMKDEQDFTLLPEREEPPDGLLTYDPQKLTLAQKAGYQNLPPEVLFYFSKIVFYAKMLLCLIYLKRRKRKKVKLKKMEVLQGI